MICCIDFLRHIINNKSIFSKTPLSHWPETNDHSSLLMSRVFEEETTVTNTVKPTDGVTSRSLFFPCRIFYPSVGKNSWWIITSDIFKPVDSARSVFSSIECRVEMKKTNQCVYQLFWQTSVCKLLFGLVNVSTNACHSRISWNTCATRASDAFENRLSPITYLLQSFVQ